jgi:hypothetical protein
LGSFAIFWLVLCRRSNGLVNLGIMHGLNVLSFKELEVVLQSFIGEERRLIMVLLAATIDVALIDDLETFKD